MAVRTLEDRDRAAWDAFVGRCSRATFFHLASWRDVLEDVYRLQCHYIMTERNGQITAILPLALVNRPLLGRVLMSTPFCVYGGIAADNAEDELALESTAHEMAEKLGARYVELRSLNAPLSADATAVVPKDGQFFTFRKAMADSDDGNLAAVPRKQRAVIRQAINKGNFEAKVEPTTDVFYDLYAASVHRLGTPVYHRSLFKELLSRFGDAAEILTVYQGDAPQCSVLTFYHDGEVLPYFAGSRPSARMNGAYSWMYYQLMCRGTQRGHSRFDFGRSIAGTGAFSYKKNWGFEPKPLPYSYLPARGAVPKQMHPDDLAARVFAGTWQRTPSALANRLGPALSLLAC